MEFAIPSNEKNLPPAPTTRSAKTSSDAVGAQLSHRTGCTNTPENCGIGAVWSADHCVSLCSVLGTHLIEQVFTPLPIPPS